VSDGSQTPSSLHHVAFLVRDLEAHTATLARFLGREPEQRGPVPYRDAEVVIFDLGNVRLELVAPSSATSPLTEVLEHRGEGFFHLGFGAADLDAAVATVEARGFTFAAPPRVGYKDWRLAYLDADALPLFAAHLIDDDSD